jgi:multiple sugar transport system permease protein
MLAKAGIYICILIVVIVFIFPLFICFSVSLKTRGDAFASPPTWFFKPTLGNYIQILVPEIQVGGYYQPGALKVPQYWNSIFNSLVISLGTTALTLGLGTPAAYYLSRFSFKRKQDLQTWILSLRMTPPMTIVLPFYLLFISIGWYDTYQGMVIVESAFNMPFVVWMMKSCFDEVPRDLDDSALVDGCSWFSAFIKVVLPLVAAGLVASAIFTMIFTWNEFLFAVVLTSMRSRTIVVRIQGLMSGELREWGIMTALGTTIILPVFIFALLVQKYIIRGLTLGAVKG